MKFTWKGYLKCWKRNILYTVCFFWLELGVSLPLSRMVQPQNQSNKSLPEVQGNMRQDTGRSCRYAKFQTEDLEILLEILKL